MSAGSDPNETLTVLNYIADTLNRAVDVRSVLDDTLAHLVKLMGLETGWIFLKAPEAPAGESPTQGSGYVLASYHNLPPALDPADVAIWERGCDCQALCSEGCLTEAYNVLQCGRLDAVIGDRRGLALHASTPLRSGDKALGILNVAGTDWSSFSPEALALLTNVGSQIGVALERARLFDLLQDRRIHEQEMLLDFSRQLLNRRDLDDLVVYLVEEARKLLFADACALLLPGEDPSFLEFRAACGWTNDPSAERRQIPADADNGPGLVMRTQRPLLVEDLQQNDPAFFTAAWLQQEGFRGHAVVPLRANGRSIGALVINHRQPRLLEEDDLRFLQLAANQAAMAIEQARLQEEEIRVQALERELAVGRQIQISLLPSSLPVAPGWEFAAFYQAAREVGGDFYDFFGLPGEPDRLGMVIADVTGKGVPAALFMARSSTLIRTTGLSRRSPSAALIEANELILKDRRADLLLSAFYGVLDTQSGRFDYANAGHNPPLWVQASTGTIEELRAPGILLGGLDEIELEERTRFLAPGDLLVLYTDGVSEAMDVHHQLFGEERLRQTVAANATASAQQLLEAIVEAVQTFTGPIAPSDDLTLVAVKRCAHPLAT